jgi:glycosyltransferase involved in cell wall biosynthesis
MQKRILYIGNKPSQSSGTTTTIETLSLLLASEGFEVITASAAKNKVLRLLDMIAATFKYRNQVDYVLIDTYSTLNFTYAVATAKLCRQFKVPYIPILHGGDLPARLKKSPKKSLKLFGKAKANVAPSAYLFEAFKDAGFTNLVHIPNTIELSNYPFLLRKEIQPRLLWVRAFAEIYNPLLALEVFKSLSAKYTKAALCMVGPEKDGSLKKCKAFADEHKLDVTFTGLISKEAWIEKSKAYDIFINTTNFDNMPVSVVEALAVGIPVISTNAGGLPFLLADGKTGLLVPPNDHTAMTAAVEKLCSNPELTASLSSSGRTYAQTFDWKNVKQDWLTLLGE